MRSWSSEIHRLVVFADCGQFYLQDLADHGSWVRAHHGDPGFVPAGWTEEAVQVHRIGVEPHSIAVGTARADLVEVTLRLHSTLPVADLAEPEHVVEADIDLPNGDLAIYGPAAAPQDEQHVGVVPGRYRARVSYVPSGPPERGGDESEPGDHFLYQIDLWLTGEPGALAVLKQGSHPWAG